MAVKGLIFDHLNSACNSRSRYAINGREVLWCDGAVHQAKLLRVLKTFQLLTRELSMTLNCMLAKLQTTWTR